MCVRGEGVPKADCLCVLEGKECPKLIVCVRGEGVLEADSQHVRGEGVPKAECLCVIESAGS